MKTEIKYAFFKIDSLQGYSYQYFPLKEFDSQQLAINYAIENPHDFDSGTTVILPIIKIINEDVSNN